MDGLGLLGLIHSKPRANLMLCSNLLFYMIIRTNDYAHLVCKSSTWCD
jgi:hypothetical protein